MKTVKRPKNRARIVITLEVEISSETLAVTPVWHRHALDILRALKARVPAFCDLSATREFLDREGIIVLSENCEIAI